MPVDKQKLLRFQVLNDCFRNRHHDYTIDDLTEICNQTIEQKFNMPGVSKRTIQNDINELLMPPYNIELDESLRIGHKRIYRYKNVEFTLKMVHFSDAERSRLEDAINVLENYEDDPQYAWVKLCLERIVSNTFTKECSELISFQSNPDLLGIQYFGSILKAIANKQPLKITYQPFPKKENSELVERPELVIKVFPYHLKQYNDRWFLIGKQQGCDRISNYAIDRIVGVELSHITYEESNIDFQEYYDNVIGVSVRDDVKDVVLRVSRERYPYIQSKPLHWTQTELKERRTKSHYIIKIKVAINNELITQIMSYANDIEVIEPFDLRETILSKITHMLSCYKQ